MTKTCQSGLGPGCSSWQNAGNMPAVITQPPEKKIPGIKLAERFNRIKQNPHLVPSARHVLPHWYVLQQEWVGSQTLGVLFQGKEGGAPVQQRVRRRLRHHRKALTSDPRKTQCMLERDTGPPNIEKRWPDFFLTELGRLACNGRVSPARISQLEKSR